MLGRRSRRRWTADRAPANRGGVDPVMLPPEPDRWTIDLANTQRMEAIAAFGFTERQARFLLNVLLHSGVFVERQYCSFAGIVHGQKSTDFLKTLVERRFATPISTGKLHRGRMFHVHYKPLWAAIGEPDNRFRKPTAQGRMIERVMLLDAVLDDREFTWLGPSMDKRRHFIRHLGDRLELRDYPHLLFGDGPEKTVRYFPDKLPIGMQPHADSHVFVYLVTRPSPMDFRLFLLRHVPLLRVLFRWTVRLLLPRKVVKARLAYLHAAREQLATPLHPSIVETLEWLFPERKRLAEPGAAPADTRYLNISSAFRTPRYRALYQQWLDDPRNTLWMAGSPIVADAIDRELGRVECVELSRQYLHLSPLVDVACPNSRGRPWGRPRKLRLSPVIRGALPEGNYANDGPPASTADNQFPGRKFHRERATQARGAALFAARRAGAGATIRAGNHGVSDPGARAANGPAPVRRGRSPHGCLCRFRVWEAARSAPRSAACSLQSTTLDWDPDLPGQSGPVRPETVGRK